MPRPAHTYRARRRRLHFAVVYRETRRARRTRKLDDLLFVPRKPLELRELPRVRTWGEGVWTAHRLRSTGRQKMRRHGPITR
jgi:hypothetical protein